MVEGDTFSTDAYNAGFKLVENGVQNDGVFGTSHAKIAVVTATIENCGESADGSKTIDVVYRIFSSEPIFSVQARPEERYTAVDKPATVAAEQNTQAFYTLQSVLGYDNTRRGFGGGDLTVRIPGKIVDDFRMSGSGSSSSRVIEAQLTGSKTIGMPALDRLEYHLAYDYSEMPASRLQLVKGVAHFRVIGVSKPIESESARIVLRYGGSIEQGIQQSGLTASHLSADAIANSAYGALRLYTGVTATTRYSEAAVSYGIQIGGAGLDDLSFTKHVGDAIYSCRFPGGTHLPWDLQARFSAGGIGSNRGVPLTERFFGGNSVSAFIPGDSWLIPNGPLVRSIAANRLTGAGAGGTSFYATNLTLGKVIKSYPLVPAVVETAEGFSSGVEAAENSAQQFFADDYETASPEFKELAVRQGSLFREDMDGLQATLNQIRVAGPVPHDLDPLLKDAERQAHRVQNLLGHATVPDGRGRVNALELRTLINPASSLMQKLLDSIAILRARVEPALQTRLDNFAGSVTKHVGDLEPALEAIHRGPAGVAAADRARRDMIRPREIIDTLRHEVNCVAFSVVGMFDTGRLWPDPYGTRYAVGAGGRVSILNVNLTTGYAFNPRPRNELGQGRGTLLLTLTYTNLF